jgi:hypothetical protein
MKDKGKGKVSDTYLIFIIQAYETMTDTGQLMDSAIVELIDEDAANAIERAKMIIAKKFYRISSVIEKQTCQCNQDHS